jgi:hypothetical protein
MKKKKNQNTKSLQPLVDSWTGATFGDVVPPRNFMSSKLEDQVRAYLVEAGYPVAERQGILCYHPDKGKNFLTLTPDIVLVDQRLVIEVDPCSPSSRGLTHHGSEAEDKLRNELLEAVGWTVIRLRLGCTEGGHIGDRDVIVESDGFTKAAKSGLIEALEDFKEGRPASVRLVKKASERPATQRRSHVVRIGEYNYADGGHIFSWYPDLNSERKVTLRLCVDGRYLYTHGSPPLFIAEVGLHEMPRKEWVDKLTRVLCDMDQDELGTTKWPWGDSLLVADLNLPVARQLVETCEYGKRTIDQMDLLFSISGHPIACWTPSALISENEDTLASIHPEASFIGYHIAEVTRDRGPHGPYQRIYISRTPRPAP